MEWLGEVPVGWKVERLKCLATVNDEALPESTDPDLELSYVDISSVDAAAGIVAKETLPFERAPSRARRVVRRGDVIVSSVRTYLRAIAAIENPEPNLIVSTGFAVIRPRRLDTSFTAYALRAPYFIERVVANSTGVSYPAINASELGCFPIAYPAPVEQRTIAAFLDRETAKIDALVTKKERLIALLQEKRTALVTQAVTKGLDPKVPMKDSGAEWLGEIPAHWKPVKIKHLFHQRKRQSHPELNVLSVYRDFGVIEKSSRDDNINKTPEDLTRYQLVEVGDLVINKMKAWQGSLGVSGHRGITSPDYIVYVPIHSERPRFLHHLLRDKLLADVYRSVSNGIRPSQWRLEPERFEELIVLLPPDHEQNRIAAHLDEGDEQLEALIQRAERALQLLQEFRTALISAAVTGKIDVREEAA